MKLLILANMERNAVVVVLTALMKISAVGSGKLLRIHSSGMCAFFEDVLVTYVLNSFE